MGSENIKLPKIDFSHEDLKPDTLVWNQVKSQVHKALVEYGCFEASFDKISIHLRKSIFEFSQEIFDLPLETKLRNISTEAFHGYVGNYHPLIQLFESMGIDDANIFHEVEKFTQILWPQGNPSFCKTIQSYSEQLAELDQTIRRMIMESLGVEKYMDEHMNSTNFQDQVNGLQVLTKDGQWKNLDPTPNTFTVIVGDSLHAWTNGRMHAPYHRVMMRGKETRYSVGLFSTPKAGYIIKAPEELVDEEHPLLYKPYNHGEFHAFSYSEKGMKCESALKTYCGV
ncbi:LOW QUALITY PROTEIN: 2-oxoglutarate-dependent dioxygenase AOP2-like [Solanum tuberosum]|uniref:LOW QUALITY PROTEIN: 2-oxoglutarate-dependent dioxygenase AOP2-like n=1 Tax=Solanum tuberosum TaxID=4113 RepID=UPI00073A411A|nr:PREDICTED: LOW QUALITY PROTEIN: 2-oxoglutarate-dependent dioxygenase AOP2-like [Solanum tuberosum]